MESLVAVITPNNQVVSADVTEGSQVVSANVDSTVTLVSSDVEITVQEVNATVNSSAQTVVAVIAEGAASANIDHIELELKMTSSLFRYKEFTYNVEGDISLQEIWDSSLKGTKYYNITYSYTLGDLVNIEVERVSDGFTYNKEFEYDLQGNLTTINII